MINQLKQDIDQWMAHYTRTPVIVVTPDQFEELYEQYPETLVHDEMGENVTCLGTPLVICDEWFQPQPGIMDANDQLLAKWDKVHLHDLLDGSHQEALRGATKDMFGHCEGDQ